MGREKLAICAHFENAASLPEWLAYHRVVGVEHFVLYDSGSNDTLARVVRDMPIAEHVTLIRWQQRPGQLAAYRHFIDIFAPGFAWAAFLGVDEFLLPLSGDTVLSALDFLDQAGAVLVHRRVFSPGPGPEPPSGLAIEFYDRRAGDDFAASRHIRAIVRCSDLLDVTQTPHEFRINGSVFDTAGRQVPNSAVQEFACYRNLVVNCYCTGPRQNWLARLQQESSAAGGVLAALSQVQDDAIRMFVPAVRGLLGPAPARAAGVAVPEETVGWGAPVVSSAERVPAESPVSEPAKPVPVAIQVPAEDVPAGPPPRTVVVVPSEIAPDWIPLGEDAQERVGGMGLVFRDRSRAGGHWLAALRGAAAIGIDPAFLMDDYDRIREFPDAATARAACDAALGQKASA